MLVVPTAAAGPVMNLGNIDHWSLVIGHQHPHNEGNHHDKDQQPRQNPNSFLVSTRQFHKE